jgi:WhiA C-terminal HTH domain/WhiA LAGLIDADG-like domain
VSRSERDLVAALRAEIAAIDPSRPCDRVAESAGLSGTPARTLAGRRSTVGRLLVRLRRSRPSASGDEAAPTFDWASAAEHCRTAWLRGRFLANGSLSLAGGRTHLEFVVDADEAPVLAARLAEVGLPASFRVRRGRGVVTWKSGDTIDTFLRRIGGAGALLELEARQVSRALRGDLNRVLNAESANLHRAVGAAGRQLAAIADLDAEGRLREQPYVVRVVAAARRETPEATLGELAERLSLHRSAVQRALERIERMSLHPERAPTSRTRRAVGPRL